MRSDINQEILLIYGYITKLQNDIADIAKEVAEDSIIQYNEINGTPENLSDFNNDQHFITSEDLEEKISELPKVDETLFLRVRGLDNQECLIPTKFNVLKTETLNEDDSSDNVATTAFVHALIDDSTKGLSDTISIVLRLNEEREKKEGDYTTRKDVQRIVNLALTQYDTSTVVNQKIEAAINQLDIPTKTSDLYNDSGYITLEDIPIIEPGVVSVNGMTGVVTLDIPSKTSDLYNDSGYITESAVTSVNGRTGAVTVLENVRADWNASSGDAAILNKPALKRVATTGSYNDLIDTPDLSIYATLSLVDSIISATMDYVVIAETRDRIIT